MKRSDADHMDDDTFLAYCETHSEAERPMFHTDDVARLLHMAGHSSKAVLWEAMDTIVVIDLRDEVEEARAIKGEIE